MTTSGVSLVAQQNPQHRKEKTWRGSNLLGEILTEISEEFLFMSNPDREGVDLIDSEYGQILTIGLSMGQETDFGRLQRKCPEGRNFIEFLENGTLPTDRKWKRRVENDAKDYYMKGGMLWHSQKSTGRRQTFQDQMDQLVVPTTERNDTMHWFHTKALAYCGFDKTY